MPDQPRFWSYRVISLAVHESIARQERPARTFGSIRQVAFSSTGDMKNSLDCASTESAGGNGHGPRRCPHQTKGPFHILGREIRSLAVHVEKAILGRGVQHRLAHDGVLRVREVDNRELDGRCGGGGFLHDGSGDVEGGNVCRGWRVEGIDSRESVESSREEARRGLNNDQRSLSSRGEGRNGAMRSKAPSNHGTLRGIDS